MIIEKDSPQKGQTTSFSVGVKSGDTILFTTSLIELSRSAKFRNHIRKGNQKYEQFKIISPPNSSSTVEV